MRILILAATAIALTSCATVKETYTADGRKAYTLNCSGTARGWDKCFAAAGDLCKASGYEVLDRTSESTAAIGGGSGGFYGSKSNERAMVIACKAPQ